MKLLIPFLLVFALGCADEFYTEHTGSSHDHEDEVGPVCPDPDGKFYEIVFDDEEVGTAEIEFTTSNTFFRRVGTHSHTAARGTFDLDTCKLNGVLEFKHNWIWRSGPGIFGEMESSGVIYGPGFEAREVW